ncbi:hypothetical protein Cni_G07098 [Canna indica]|uniref:TF-B3 domain-containing protein n=1 Tax=Canna indica TaxID=4628 RepID=A0AAQ3K0I4_9LILI|nr:hypothetical protein Cni_G07098 [Canna indica]
MDSNRFYGFAEEYLNDGAVNCGVGDTLKTAPESSWGNAKGQGLNPAEILFPESCYIGQADAKNDDQAKDHYFSHNGIASSAQFTSNATENLSCDGLRMIQPLNFSWNVRPNIFLDSVLKPNMSLPEMLQNRAFPVPNNDLSMTFTDRDGSNILAESKWNLMSNSGCGLFQLWENNELGTLQLPNPPIFQNQLEATNDLEFRCRGLQVVLCKELTNSDVGNVGRIVLPKREAEAGLPPLSERHGILLEMNDMTILDITWKFKYRFWPNNKTRMYVLENTGGFVKAHFLQQGDSLIIYRNSTSGNFLVGAKKANSQLSPTNEEDYYSNSVMNANKDRGDRFPVKPIKNIEHGSSSLNRLL